MKHTLYNHGLTVKKLPWNDKLFAMGLFLYVACGFLDGYLTLRGMHGNLMLEGNPIIRNWMHLTGAEIGLIVPKLLTFIYVLVIGVVGAQAIKNDHPWIYGAALSSKITSWLKKKKRIWVAYIPLYVTAVGQLIGALVWLHLELTFPLT